MMFLGADEVEYRPDTPSHYRKRIGQNEQRLPLVIYRQGKRVVIGTVVIDNDGYGTYELNPTEYGYDLDDLSRHGHFSIGVPTVPYGYDLNTSTPDSRERERFTHFIGLS